MAQAKKVLAKKSRSTATKKQSQTYTNYIGGRWVPSSNGEWIENRNPADTRDLIGRFPQSTEADVDAAVAAATKAFDGWRQTPAPRRAEILFRVGEILIRDKEKYTRDMTREMGKVLKEAGGDVQEAIDCTYYAAGEGRRLHGFTTPAEMPNKFAMCVRQPVGPCGLITPWNFPMAIPS
ncbi:MAG TPA: aldehyde dehydrogenase, partial [Blastocatellia bacterium]|nr:aldehyde dehydrogenase [Blastocatellia bacterium]